MTISRYQRFVRTCGLVLACGMAQLSPASATITQTIENTWYLCAAPTLRAEQAHGLPQYLLTAISKVEAGRWHAQTKANFAWPWTVTAGGEGRFLPSKAAAIAEVRQLQARGVRNIDVGCMQINLKYHPKAFTSLEQAFDPDHNVEYALRFLRQLKGKWGSWTRAIGNYHSNTPALSGRYRLKVFRAVYAERRLAARARRSARLARQQAKNAAVQP